jgi:four helix bundle protein
MKEPAKSFEDLMVWPKAHQFVLAVYRLTRSFPKSESIAFRSQLLAAYSKAILNSDS